MYNSCSFIKCHSTNGHGGAVCSESKGEVVGFKIEGAKCYASDESEGQLLHFRTSYGNKFFNYLQYSSLSQCGHGASASDSILNSQRKLFPFSCHFTN